MRALVLAAISAYQRYLSPLKGFCCAYRVHTGRKSCSVLGYRAVRRYGVLHGLRILRRRTFLCGVAYRRHAQRPLYGHAKEHGFCDSGCDIPCDFDCSLPTVESCPSVADFLGCLDCGSCDWPSRERKHRAQEHPVYIPPHSE